MISSTVLNKKPLVNTLKKKIDNSVTTPRIMTERISLKSPVAQLKANNSTPID